MFGVFFFFCIFSPNIASIARKLDDATTTNHHNFEKRQTYETMVSIRNDIAKEGVSLLKGGEELDSVYELRRVWVQHLLIPFTPKGYGWRGSWVTCILRAAFISIRRGFDPRPNLICVPSREQTLFENETGRGRLERATLFYFFPFLFFPTSVVILLWHRVFATPSLRHMHTHRVSWALGVLFELARISHKVWSRYEVISPSVPEVTNLTYLFIYTRDRRLLIV